MKNLLMAIVLLVGCSSKTKIEESKPSPNLKESQPETSPIHQMIEHSEEPKRSLGLILGPGGIKALAHVGVLHEIQSQKIPVDFIAGIEWGALVGAFYAQNSRVHEAEWKIIKLPFEKFISKGLFKDKKIELPPNAFQDYLTNVFKIAQIQNFKIDFLCPSHSNGDTAIVSEGSANQEINKCWQSRPHFQEDQSAVSALGLILNRAEKANVKNILFINVVSESDIAELSKQSEEWKQYWEYYKQIKVGGELAGVVDINLEKYNVRDYDKGRDIVRMGRVQSREKIKQIIKKYNL